LRRLLLLSCLIISSLLLFAGPAAAGSPFAPDAAAPIPPASDVRSLPLPDPGPLGPIVSVSLASASGDLVDDAPAPQPPPRVYSYTVVEGDTFWDIAEQFGVTVETVLGANPTASPSRLGVGQVIRVPSIDCALHVVVSGDTLTALAAKYRVEAAAIVKANTVDDPSSLTPGRELIIPGATPVIVHKVSLSNGSGQTATLTGNYHWPVSGFVSSKYGWRWGRFHHGVDIAAPYGRSIVAARSGKVVFSGWKGGYGYTIVLSHGDGVTTLYGHASRLIVGYGEWVEAGTVIARVGSTGYSTGNHCHFEVRVNGVSVNPRDVLP
jgi:LysM repeat protein